jgi:hypothetical protein
MPLVQTEQYADESPTRFSKTPSRYSSNRLHKYSGKTFSNQYFDDFYVRQRESDAMALWSIGHKRCWLITAATPGQVLNGGREQEKPT